MELGKTIHAASSNALGLLEDYGSSNDSSSEDEQHIQSPAYQNSCDKVTNEKKLPLPTSIKLFGTCLKSDTPEDNPDLHDGRIRSFAHQRGNWSTYVYIPFNKCSEYINMCDGVISASNHYGFALKPIEDPHVSLTRTVVLLHHWIDTFVKSVQVKISQLQRFFIQFGHLAVYCNEERTRTFLGLTINVCDDILLQSVELLNSCLAEFKLPAFYENPSFHLSIAWTLGDKKEDLDKILPKLQDSLQTHINLFPELRYLEVTNYVCKTGNKVFAFDLKK